MTVHKIIEQSINSGVFYLANTVARILLTLALGKCLAPDSYGSYSLIVAMFGAAACILPLGVSNYYAREIPGLSEPHALGVFKSIAGIYCLVILAIAASFFLFPGILVSILGVQNETGVGFTVVVVSTIFIFDNVATECARYLYARKEIYCGNLTVFIQTGLWAFIVFAVFGVRPAWIDLPSLLLLWAFGAVTAAVYGLSQVGIAKLLSASFDPKLYGMALRFGMPILLGNALAVANWLGRFILAGFHSTEAVGVFSYNYGLILMIAGISMPLINSVEPYIIEAYSRGELQRSWSLIATTLRYRVLLIGPMVVIMFIWGVDVVRLLARQEYIMNGEALWMLMPIPFLMVLSNTFERVLFLYRRTLAIGFSYVAAAIMQIVLFFIFVPLDPYMGAVLATDGGLILLTVLLWRLSWQPMVSLRKVLGPAVLAGIPSVCVAWGLAQALPPQPRALTLIVVALAVTIGHVLSAYLLRAIEPLEARTFWDFLILNGKRIVPGGGT